MSLTFSVADADLDKVMAVEFSRGDDNVARVHVRMRAASGPAALFLDDVDTLDACVADGTITATERTALTGAGGVLRRLAQRARGRLGAAP